MEEFTTIKIRVWRTEDSTVTESRFDNAVNKAEMDAYLDEAIDELLVDKLKETGFDTEEEGVYFTFN